MVEEKDIDPSVLDEEKEARIIEACAAGNWDEFPLIFDKYRDKIYFLALSIVKERALALDVTQNTFIKVYKTLKWFNQRSRFSTWLFRITYNQALDQYRKRRRRVEVEFSEEVGSKRPRSPNGALFHDIAARELSDKISAAVEALPLKLRTVVILRYVEGQTYSEICRIVGCARGVLQKRLSQASKKLKDMLKNEISELQR